jgi:glycosyltransferase involved in cell wall biosynthesis
VSDAAGIGEFVPAGDAMSIAKSLLDVVEDEERRERLAERGHERVLSELALDHTARAVESAYQAALE